MVGELRHLVHHPLQSHSAGVVQGGRLGGHHDTLQQLTELVAGVHHLVAYVLCGHLPHERVPNENQFVSAQNDEFAVGHEDARGLRSIDAAKKGVDGVEEVVEVSLALVGVEQKQLAVAGGGRAVRRLQSLRWFPLGDVVLHRLCDLLLQTLELVDLQGKAKGSCQRMFL